jgi:hypothetical protein
MSLRTRCCGSKNDGTVPPDNPFVGRRVLGRKSLRSVTGTSWVWRYSPIQARFGNVRTGRTAATKSTFFRRGRITDGPW